MILSLHHAQITVPRGTEDLARQFYCGLLGLPEIEKPESLKPRGGFWMQAGDRQVHVGTEDGVDRAVSKAHLAYEVSDIEHWRRRLTEQGVKVLEGIPVPGMARFEFRDPFGNRIEFLQRVAGTAVG